MPKSSGNMSTQPNYHFITVTDWSQRSDPEIQKTIRSQAMRDFRRRTRKPTPNPEDQYLDISSLLIAGAGMTARVDPFARYPVDMNARAWELVNHVHGESCGMFKAMRAVGFFQIMADPAGFHLMLSSAAWHMAHLRGSEKAGSDIDFVSHANAGIQSVKQRLADAAQAISDNMIGNIIAFSCHANMTEDVDSFNMHFNGLQEIIRRRGGLGALQANPLLRLMIFWTDVNGAMAQDTFPRFPPPTDLLPRLPPTYRDWSFPSVIENTEINARTFLPVQSSLVEIFQDISHLNTAIMVECESRPIWQDAMFPGMNVMPLIYRLLILPHTDPSKERLASAQVIKEACRLAALLYLGEIRRCFSIAQIPSSLYVRKLYVLLVESQLFDWDPYNVVYLWVLLMGGVCAGISSDRAEERTWFVHMVVQAMQKWKLHSFEEVVTVAAKFLWVTDVFEKIQKSFQREIDIRTAPQNLNSGLPG